MKKIITLLALLCMSTVGWSQITATLMEGYGEPLTLDQFKALAGTNGRFGFVASSNTAADNTAPRCDHWVRWTSSHTGNLDDTALFYLEASGSNYLVKRASDNQYVITSTSSTSFGASGTAFKLVNRNPNDATAAVWGSQSISFEDPANSSYHYNANAVKYNTGPGAWTTYAVFGPIYKNITIDCQENGVSMSGYPQVSNYKIGGDVSAPAFPGKKQVAGDPTSVTVDQDDMVITFKYEASTYDYTLVVNGAPSGTTMTIKSDDVAIDATNVSFASEVVPSDVVVTFPTEFSYLQANVTISGTTITVNCEDPRWPVNFPKTQTFTRSDRYINSVTFETDGGNQTVDGFYVDVNSLCYQDLTATKTVTLFANTSVHPAFKVAGEWQHGFVYIDLNNDGDFTDAGELVAKVNEGNPNLATAIPNFTTPAAGTYRMRVKTDWASEDPGGNIGDEPHDISSNNHIINNGGMIVDMTLEVKSQTEEEIYDQLISRLEAINFGTGLNQYSFTGSYVGYTASTINDLKAQGYTAENLEMAEALLANYALNMPTAGFYRIKGNTSSKYLAAGKASNGKFAMTDAIDATTVFYFDGSKLVNYSTGMANGVTASAWAWVTLENASAVEFQDGLTNGGYAIKTATVYFYDNGDNSASADRGGNMTITTGTNARYTNWYLEPVTELPLTLADVSSYGVDGYYTTMYLPVNVTVSDAKAYAVTDGSGNSLNVEELTDGFVPANTGVVLEGISTSATATVTTATGTVTSSLQGAVGETATIPTDTYVLSVANSKLGFYKFAGTELKGFRAYYVGASADPTRGFVLNFGGTATGINAATLNANGNAYDLQGRRVNNAQKGVFIINGKKVVK